jgi:hypothetical protein
VFINHLDAGFIRNRDFADFFSIRGGKKDELNGNDTMFKRLEHHGLVALEITGSYIARGMPFYTIKLA